MVRKKTIYKVIKYVMIIIAYIIAFKQYFMILNRNILYPGMLSATGG